MPILPLLSGILALCLPAQPSAKPTTAPEERRRVYADPMAAFANLVSGSGERRKAAWLQLGVPPDRLPGEVELEAARILVENLDADPEPEVVLAHDMGGRETVARVFDHASGVWWQVGEFTASWHWFPGQADRMVSIRDGQIAIRIRAGGSQAQGTTLSLYRLHGGRLYKTFAMEEEEEGSDEKGNSALRERTLTPIAREGAPAMLVVETVRRAAPDSEFYGPPQRTGCIAYEWRAAQFRWLADAGLSKEHCNSGSAGPRRKPFAGP